MTRRRVVAGLSLEDIRHLSDDLPPITAADLRTAAGKIRPTVTTDAVNRHEEWRRQKGAE